jgi:excisionase family DNA binding protein
MADTVQVFDGPWRNPLEASQHLRCSRSFLLRKARSGELRGHKLGRVWRFHVDDLTDFMRRSRKPLAMPVPSISARRRGQE